MYCSKNLIGIKTRKEKEDFFLFLNIYLEGKRIKRIDAVLLEKEKKKKRKEQTTAAT